MPNYNDNSLQLPVTYKYFGIPERDSITRTEVKEWTV